MPHAPLAGKTVLVVEDELMIALDIVDCLLQAGAKVIGPCTSLEDARKIAGDGEIDLAILDIDLGGREVFPAARILGARGIPFLFYTGRPQRDALETDFAGVPVCTKPMATDRLIATLVGMAPVAA